MSQLHCIRKRKSGHHLRYEDRRTLEYLVNRNLRRIKKDRLSQKALADLMCCSESTISRELRRGRVEQKDTEWRTYYSYSADVAQARVQKHWTNKGPSLKIGKDHDLCQQLEEMLLGKKMKDIGRLRYSPEAIVMYFDKEGWPTGLRLSARTIYNYVYRNLFMAVSRADLPRKGVSPKRRYRRVGKRLRPPEQKRISERPDASEGRSEVGHWEMDCIESVKSDKTCLLTLVDRCSRECLIFKLGAQTQDAVIRRINGLERKMGTKAFREKFKSITSDNGTEFLNWEGIENAVLCKGKRTSIYYANPYSSWERGTNENLNGFIRYFIPKGTRLKDITQRELKQLEEFLNSYPRKILGAESPKNFNQAAA